jgi:hypothetical protein
MTDDAKPPKRRTMPEWPEAGNLTKEERLAILRRVYDQALIWCADQVECYRGKGTAAAGTMMERARLEIKELNRTSDEEDKVLTIRFEHELPPSDG